MQEQIDAARAVAEALPGTTSVEVTSYAVWAHDAHGTGRWVCIGCQTVNEPGPPLARYCCRNCDAVLTP